MQFTVKYFSEITIKSKAVRRQFCKRLASNLKKLLQPLDGAVEVQGQWDKLTINSGLNDEQSRKRFIEVLSHTPGIANFLDVVEYPLGDMHDTYSKVADLYGERIAGKRFVVRCKRAGQHDFKSGDVERYVGGGLNQNFESNGVDLNNPDITVGLEIRDEKLFVINERHEGLGGFPIGSVDSVISLVSGGFDSTVATYMMMKRGLRTHFLFFNIGGHAHEVGVKEVALYLWMKYGASHTVLFISVPFEGVVEEILNKVDNSQMGVILKRMMLRAGSIIAEDMSVDALVTGEAVAQVSSQTLTNLSVIDSITDTLVLRPLIVADKRDIIRTAVQIGTEEFAANMPEYCGVISVKPTTKAKPEKIEREEAKFDMAVLDKAIADTRYNKIQEIDLSELEAPEVEVLAIPQAESLVIDVRHPDEQELAPLKLAGNAIMHIPFFELHRKFVELDQKQRYMLYCDKGVMSRLHASHLRHEGYTNVTVYRPN